MWSPRSEACVSLARPKQANNALGKQSILGSSPVGSARISSYNFATPSPVAVTPATDPLQNPSSFHPLVADQITKLQEQIETLQKQQELEKQQLEQQIQQQAQFARTVRESEAEAVRLYPDAGITGSVFANKMIEIADPLEKQRNPLIYEADSPLKIAHMAAKELGIAPR